VAAVRLQAAISADGKIPEIHLILIDGVIPGTSYAITDAGIPAGLAGSLTSFRNYFQHGDGLHGGPINGAENTDLTAAMIMQGVPGPTVLDPNPFHLMIDNLLGNGKLELLDLKQAYPESLVA